MEVFNDMENYKYENQLPNELKKFNWGAFLLTWIWGLGNKTYIALLIFPLFLLKFIPFIGPILVLAFCIWLGIKGNEFAWKNKQWRDIEHFNKIQRRWACVGPILYILFFGWTIFLMLLPAVVK